MTKQTFFVGCFTRPLQPHGEDRGIYRCSLDLKTGELLEHDYTAPLFNPTYLTLSPEGAFLYAVEREPPEGVSALHAFRLAEGGRLESLSRASIPSDSPCHVSVHASRRWVGVANYNTGDVGLFELSDDGTIGGLRDFVEHEGSSIHPERQTEPHAHAAVFAPDALTLFVPDLGTDEIKVYRVQEAAGKLEPLPPVKMTPGAGVRHLSFHPSAAFAFAVNELTSTVTVLRYEGGTLTPLESVPMLPEGFTGENTAAAIEVAPSGRFVYASNRGHDSIAVFAFDAVSGSLKRVQTAPSGGQKPRDFTLDPSGRFMVVTNQGSDSLSSFRVDADSGMLEATGYSLPLHRPVCVKMLES